MLNFLFPALKASVKASPENFNRCVLMLELCKEIGSYEIDREKVHRFIEASCKYICEIVEADDARRSKKAIQSPAPKSWDQTIQELWDILPTLGNDVANRFDQAKMADAIAEIRVQRAKEMVEKLGGEGKRIKVKLVFPDETDTAYIPLFMTYKVKSNTPPTMLKAIVMFSKRTERRSYVDFYCKTNTKVEEEPADWKAGDDVPNRLLAVMKKGMFYLDLPDRDLPPLCYNIFALKDYNRVYLRESTGKLHSYLRGDVSNLSLSANQSATTQQSSCAKWSDVYEHVFKMKEDHWIITPDTNATMSPATSGGSSTGHQPPHTGSLQGPNTVSSSGSPPATGHSPAPSPLAPATVTRVIPPHNSTVPAPTAPQSLPVSPHTTTTSPNAPHPSPLQAQSAANLGNMATSTSSSSSVSPPTTAHSPANAPPPVAPVAVAHTTPLHNHVAPPSSPMHSSPTSLPQPHTTTTSPSIPHPGPLQAQNAAPLGQTGTSASSSTSVSLPTAIHSPANSPPPVAPVVVAHTTPPHNPVAPPSPPIHSLPTSLPKGATLPNVPPPSRMDAKNRGPPMNATTNAPSASAVAAASSQPPLKPQATPTHVLAGSALLVSAAASGSSRGPPSVAQASHRGSTSSPVPSATPSGNQNAPASFSRRDGWFKRTVKAVKKAVLGDEPG